MYSDEVSIKEQAMHYTLNDFKFLIDRYGPAEVLSYMDEETYWKLYKYLSME